MALSKYIWTLEEINKLPEFGGSNGWFYGLVKHHETGRVYLYEIYPGMGYARTGWFINREVGAGLKTLPKTLRWVITDILFAKKAKIGSR